MSSVVDGANRAEVASGWRGALDRLVSRPRRAHVQPYRDFYCSNWPEKLSLALFVHGSSEPGDAEACKTAADCALSHRRRATGSLKSHYN